MPAAIRIVDRFRDLADVNFTPGAGVDGYAMVYDHATGKLIPSASVLNAGTLDGLDSTDFALASHTHPLSALSQSGATTGQAAVWDGAAWAPGSAGVTDHGALTGLADDDHAGYALLLGRAGGQTLNLGLNSADAGTINASAHATKGALTLGASQVIVPAGTAALPAVAFTGDTDNGMYYIGANNWALGRNGNPMIEFGPGGVDLSKFHKAAQFVEAIRCADGSAGIPGITFQNDQDTGIFRTGTDSIAIASGGVAWWTFGSAVATLMRQTIMVTNSAAITPSVVRGAASQSANLQEWQSSAGTVLAKVDASGYPTFGSASQFVFASSYCTLTPVVYCGANIYSVSDQDTGFGWAFVTEWEARMIHSGTAVLRVGAAKMGFFNTAPVAKATALTAADAGALNTGDAGSDTVIANIRTRLGELESRLQAYGLLT